MKKITYLAIAALLTSLSACDIDEEYKSQLDQNVVYTTVAGFDGLINACYENMYYMYGKEDGIPMMEMGDLWQNGSATSGNWKECVNNLEWNTETGVNRVIWNALYATIAYCNTAIYYQNECPAYDPTAMKAKVAEAYFMRGFSYFHVVEQWGGVTLTTTSMAEAGAREHAYRSTEEEIYDQVMSDLMTAYQNLPETQGQERGRATKYAAAAMLCKAWIQRSRLERDFAENPDGHTKWASVITNEGSVKYTAAQCADSAFKYAQIVINSGKYQLYPSDETSSGSTKEWLGENNKNNSEFIFLEAIDHENGYNPEGWNRGRTRQYYMMNIGSMAANFGVQSDGIRYGRANTTRVRPTLYLLHDCFDPKPSETDVASTVYCDDKTREWTADTRFDDSFYYKYFISSGSFPVPRTPPTSGMPIRQRATSRATPSRATSPHPNNSRQITLATTITPTMARWQAPRSSNSRIVLLPLDAIRLTSPLIPHGVLARSTSWQVCPASVVLSIPASSPICRIMAPWLMTPTIVRSPLHSRSFLRSSTS